MKMFISFVLCGTISINLFGDIVNACELDLLKAEQAFYNLQTLLENKEVNQQQFDRIWSHYLRVKRELKPLKECAAKTNQLLEALTEIHPELIYEISGIQKVMVFRCMFGFCRRIKCHLPFLVAPVSVTYYISHF